MVENKMREPTKLIKPGMVCAEIGVWKGSYSKEILSKKPGTLHLIDPWAFQEDFPKRWYGGKRAKTQEDMDAIHNNIMNVYGVLPNVKVHRMFSYEGRNKFKDGYFDWVYIDGNHEFEYVLTDMFIYWQKVKKGGFLTGDDYTKPGKSVTESVNYFCKVMNLNLKIYPNRQFIIKK